MLLVKILNQKTEVLSNFEGETQSFKIDSEDPFIFNVLRKSMYSDPLKTVVQEILSNSRDSHRESNKANIPVEVTINQNEGYIVFTDFGVGISEDRMEQIFLWYGRSTKRNDNRQVGGFGLGCKSPFSLSDSFLITTKVDNHCYEYCAFIDESSKGALKLIDKREMRPGESTGTEIRVPVGRNNCATAAQHVRDITQWWSPPAILHGFPKIKNIQPFLSGTGWVILSEETRNSINKVPVCICDGIPFYNSPPSDKGISIPRNVILVFKTGEVQISANRESLYWSDITSDAFKNKIENFRKEYKVHLEKDLNNLTEWEDKILYLNNTIKVFNDRKIIEGLSYKNPVDINVSETNDKFSNGVYSFKYKDGFYERHLRMEYSICNFVNASIGYYSSSMMNVTGFAKSVKEAKINKNLFVIFNDMIDVTAERLREQCKAYEVQWKKYEERLDEYNKKLRKSCPSRPSLKMSKPNSGVLTNDLRLKLNKYVKTNKLEHHHIFIVSLPENVVPIKHNIKLSEIDKIELPKPERTKRKKKEEVPTRFYAYQEYYHHSSICSIKKEQTLFAEFATLDLLSKFLRQYKSDFTTIKTYLKKNFDLNFMLITTKELALIKKYESHHKVDFKLKTIQNFTEEILKESPHIQYSNIAEYNNTIKSTINENFIKLIKNHGNSLTKQYLETIQEKPIFLTVQYNGKNYSINNAATVRENLELLTSLDGMKTVLDKHPKTIYNVSEVSKTIDKIKTFYPLLKYAYISTDNYKDYATYLDLINNS